MNLCVECGSTNTNVKLTVDRGGRLVRFRVDCETCGGFSHYLPYDERNRAVREYLNVLNEGFTAAFQGQAQLDLIASNRDEILKKHEEAIKLIRAALNDVDNVLWSSRYTWVKGKIDAILQALSLYHPMNDTWEGFPKP